MFQADTKALKLHTWKQLASEEGMHSAHVVAFIIIIFVVTSNDDFNAFCSSDWKIIFT